MIKLIESVSEDDVRELVLYITNDGDLYRSMITPTINNLKRKIKRGVYDDTLALKAWTNIADAGVQKYDKEFGSGKGSLKMFDKKTREAVAKELQADYEEDVFEDSNVEESVRTMRSRNMNESDDVVDRKGFVSLVKLNNYGSYSVLNDGYFVIRIVADDDADAKRQFNAFLNTDWKQAWRNGTLPKYFEDGSVNESVSMKEDIKDDLRLFVSENKDELNRIITRCGYSPLFDDIWFSRDGICFDCVDSIKADDDRLEKDLRRFFKRLGRDFYIQNVIRPTIGTRRICICY